jgi:hypothetical protein
MTDLGAAENPILLDEINGERERMSLNGDVSESSESSPWPIFGRSLRVMSWWLSTSWYKVEKLRKEVVSRLRFGCEAAFILGLVKSELDEIWRDKQI